MHVLLLLFVFIYLLIPVFLLLICRKQLQSYLPPSLLKRERKVGTNPILLLCFCDIFTFDCKLTIAFTLQTSTSNSNASQTPRNGTSTPMMSPSGDSNKTSSTNNGASNKKRISENACDGYFKKAKMGDGAAGHVSYGLICHLLVHGDFDASIFEIQFLCF